MSGRRKEREQALQLLYHLEKVEGDPEHELEIYWQINEEHASARPFADRLVRKVLLRKEELDRLISDASEHWALSRMDSVSRCLLRLGACEILHFPNVPPQVAIHEAVELAKKYGPESSSGFVNGILDRLMREQSIA